MTPLAEHAAPDGLALLIVDMISDWNFPDAGPIAAAALDIAPRIAALKSRCRDAGVPAIYANDNHGRWRSDFDAVVASARRAGGTAQRIVELLAPAGEDYRVLKPKHSAFYATPLGLLLEHLQVRRLLVTGVTVDQCVLVTAADARMRDLEVQVPADCVATLSDERLQRALSHLREVMSVDVTVSTQLQLPRAKH